MLVNVALLASFIVATAKDNFLSGSLTPTGGPPCSGEGFVENGTCMCNSGFTGRDEMRKWNDCQVSEHVYSYILYSVSLIYCFYFMRCVYVTCQLLRTCLIPNDATTNRYPAPFILFHMANLLTAITGVARCILNVLTGYRSYEVQLLPNLLLVVGMSCMATIVFSLSLTVESLLVGGTERRRSAIAWHRGSKRRPRCGGDKLWRRLPWAGIIATWLVALAVSVCTASMSAALQKETDRGNHWDNASELKLKMFFIATASPVAIACLLYEIRKCTSWGSLSALLKREPLTNIAARTAIPNQTKTNTPPTAAAGNSRDGSGSGSNTSKQQHSSGEGGTDRESGEINPYLHGPSSSSSSQLGQHLLAQRSSSFPFLGSLGSLGGLGSMHDVVWRTRMLELTIFTTYILVIIFTVLFFAVSYFRSRTFFIILTVMGWQATVCTLLSFFWRPRLAKERTRADTLGDTAPSYQGTPVNQYAAQARARAKARTRPGGIAPPDLAGGKHPHGNHVHVVKKHIKNFKGNESMDETEWRPGGRQRDDSIGDERADGYDSREEDSCRRVVGQYRSRDVSGEDGDLTSVSVNAGGPPERNGGLKRDRSDLPRKHSER